MLQEAIEARLPLIYAYGSDPINDLSIIQSMLSDSGLIADEALFESSEVEEATLLNTLQEGYCAVVTDAQLGAFNVSAVYEAASDCEIETGGILIILYCSGDDPTSMIKASFFCAGKVLPEERTVMEVLSNYYPGDKLEDALQYYRGLTLNEIVTVAAMSTTLYGDCSFSSVLKTRRTLMGETPGLELVDTAIGFYKPDMSLKNYAVKASKLFHVDLPDFRPRGILLTGLPGTGKTEASKYLASLLEVPLFRLDMGGMMTKWQGECHSADTEYLTQRGYLSLSEVVETDLLATIHPETGVLEFQPYLAKVEYDYEGHLLQIGRHRPLGLVTPNHRMWVCGSKLSKPSYEFYEANRLSTVPYRNSDRIRIPTPLPVEDKKEISEFNVSLKAGTSYKLKKNGKFPMNEFLEFLGYFVTEGCCRKDKPGVILLSQNPGPIAERMISVMETLFGKVWTMESRGCITIKSSHLLAWEWLADNCGGYSYQKRLPEWVFDCGPHQLKILLDAAIAGDGSYESKGRGGEAFVFNLTSFELSEQIERVATLLGYSVSSRTSQPSGNRRPQRHIYCSPRKSKTVSVADIIPVEYSGRVGCFTVKNGLLVTRYKGSTLVSGNSESNLKNALQVAVKSEPCVLLLDEVEKVLGTDSDSGGSVYRMLSQLLWWLQSHQNKILTVMTCNNLSQLPPELYRQGRVDQVIEFKGLTGIDASAFADEVCTHFEKKTGLALSDDHLVALQHMTEKWAGEDMTLAQSEIIQQVKELFIESNF